MAKLIVVPTPIGNLEDMTFRAVRMLKEVDVILAEDTRTSAKLLQHYEIKKPMQAHHLHNEHYTSDHLVSRIQNGENMALITDAGTPGISDPGFLLIRACIRAGITVECLPGPTAFVPALVQSGLSCDSFVFYGFLPQKKGRQTKLKTLVDETRTMVFYESPHRLVKALGEFALHLGADRRVVVCRELTKLHEETFRGTLTDAANHFSAKNVKGEIVLVLEGAGRKREEVEEETEEAGDED